MWAFFPHVQGLSFRVYVGSHLGLSLFGWVTKQKIDFRVCLCLGGFQKIDFRVCLCLGGFLWEGEDTSSTFLSNVWCGEKSKEGITFLCGISTMERIWTFFLGW